MVFAPSVNVSMAVLTLCVHAPCHDFRCVHHFGFALQEGSSASHHYDQDEICTLKSESLPYQSDPTKLQMRQRLLAKPLL